MTDLIPVSPQDLQLPELPQAVLPAIGQLTKILGIPRDVLASDEEIAYAWKDLPRELRSIPDSIRGELLARMCIAVSTGLFDSAINYSWNASVLQLREKVKNFGLPVVAQILQKDFEEKHLLDLQDSQLLELCVKLNLVSEDGFFFLDQCRNIRNNFSAAHPTIGTLNDREFITFLNRCVKYALADSASPRGIDIGAFISAVKGARFTDGQCSVWVDRLDATHDAQRELLFGMVHGIYCDPATPEPARLNTLDLCGAYSEKFTASIRSDLINKHSEYLAKGDSTRHVVSQQFFERLSLLNLLNESERHTIISKSVERLWTIHQEFNNFYNEPPFAERLEQLSQQGALPETVQEAFVQTVVGCYIGNGYGVSRLAEPFYVSIIKAFSPREITMMIRLARSNSVVSQRIKGGGSCRQRFIQALNLIDESSVPNSFKVEYEKLIGQQRRG
jgi:hypothetical protein